MNAYPTDDEIKEDKCSPAKKMLLEQPSQKQRYYDVYYKCLLKSLGMNDEDITEEKREEISKLIRLENKRLRKAVKDCSNQYKVSKVTFFAVGELLVKNIFPSQAVLCRQLDWSSGDESNFDKFSQRLPELFLDFFSPLSYLFELRRNTVLLKNLLAYFFTSVDAVDVFKEFVNTNINDIIHFLSSYLDIGAEREQSRNIQKLHYALTKNEKVFYESMNNYSNVDKNFNWTKGEVKRKNVEDECSVCLNEWMERNKDIQL